MPDVILCVDVSLCPGGPSGGSQLRRLKGLVGVKGSQIGFSSLIQADAFLSDDDSNRIILDFKPNVWEHHHLHQVI